jgi:hypothetical protein
MTCPHKGRGRGRKIRTNDLCFIRRDLQLIKLSLGDVMRVFYNAFLRREECYGSFHIRLVILILCIRFILC